MAQIIDRLSVNGSEYFISAVSAGNAVSANNVPAAGVAGDLAWGNVSGLAKTSADADLVSTSGFLTPDQTSAAIAKQVDDAISGLGTAMNFKGTCSVEELPANAKAGDVWNLSNDGEIGGQKVLRGDNVVRTAQGTWDVLAAYIDLSGYVQKTDEDYTTTTAAVANAVTTSGDFTTANSGKLVTVAAASAYIEDKISETVAETIDIVNDINGAASSAIPNAGAVSGYITGNTITEYTSMPTGADGSLVSNKAIKDYVASATSATVRDEVPSISAEPVSEAGDVFKLVINDPKIAIGG